jgi:integrase
MPESHPTAPAPSDKPAKPYPDFPLFPHATRRWAKKIKGRMCYFGPWNDPQGALDRYLAQKDDLHAGRTPRPDADAVTVKDAANALLVVKKALVGTGELSPRTFHDYKEVCEAVIIHMGKGRLVSDLHPDDFVSLRTKMAVRWGLLRLGKLVQFTRSLFKYALDAGLIDRPVRFGPSFKGPSQKAMRLHRVKGGPKLFTAAEVRRLGEAAGQPLKAMILLGINAGFGNSDCANLPRSAVDLDAGWIDFPRPKTGIGRRCPLWPETVEAIREALAQRPQPADPAALGLVFLTSRAVSWTSRYNPVSQQFARLLKAIGLGSRKGLGFYTLRHTFRTKADEAKDQPAADHIMGHQDQHMSHHYRETISDERLRAVTDHVRAWLSKAQPTLAGEDQLK